MEEVHAMGRVSAAERPGRLVVCLSFSRGQDYTGHQEPRSRTFPAASLRFDLLVNGKLQGHPFFVWQFFAQLEWKFFRGNGWAQPLKGCWHCHRTASSTERGHGKCSFQMTDAYLPENAWLEVIQEKVGLLSVVFIWFQSNYSNNFLCHYWCSIYICAKYLYIYTEVTHFRIWNQISM